MIFKDQVNGLLSVATSVFGESVEYWPLEGGRYVITAIFDREYEAIDPDTQVVVSSSAPRIGINLNELNIKPDKGDKVLIQGEIFTVYDSQEDGQGGATLFLHKLANEYE